MNPNLDINRLEGILTLPARIRDAYDSRRGVFRFSEKGLIKKLGDYSEELIKWAYGSADAETLRAILTEHRYLLTRDYKTLIELDEVDISFLAIKVRTRHENKKLVDMKFI